MFSDPAQSYYLLVEHKLGSECGHRQLERYRDAVHANPARRKGLIAITAVTPLKGEDAVADDPHWLGSLRWWRLVDDLRALPHADPAVAATWRAYLDLLCEQGDFGPMNADPALVHQWAKRDEAEKLLFGLLRELVQPTLEAFGDYMARPNGAAVKYRGKKDAVVVWPYRNRPLLKFRVPAEVEEERLWVQFYARDGQPRFGVEARYQHPKESLTDDAAVEKATSFLRGRGFTCRRDGSGHHWSTLVPVDEVIAGAESHDRLVAFIRHPVEDLVGSGLFDALAARTPSGPAADSEPIDAEA